MDCSTRRYTNALGLFLGAPAANYAQEGRSPQQCSQCSGFWDGDGGDQEIVDAACTSHGYSGPVRGDGARVNQSEVDVRLVIQRSDS
jgi:hypothetical protein